jgi:hypothetical protein
MRHAVFLVPALALAAAAARPAPAAADPIRLGRGFTPHPLTTPVLSARVDHVRVYDLGYKTCDPGGGAFTTRQPILTWDLTEAMPLRIRLENANGDQAGVGGVIALPDGTYVCEDRRDQFFLQQWPKGHYKLFLYGQSIGVSARVRFEDPGRSAGDLSGALRRLPTLTLGAAGAVNPAWPTLPATVAIDAGDAGPTCAHGRERVMPLAKLHVTRGSRWYLASGRHKLFVITDQQKCVDPTDGGTLAAGDHTLWAIVPDAGGPARYPFEIDDRAAPLVFAEARHQEVGGLDAPLVVSGTVRPTQRWFSRSFSCRGAARAPDLYLHSGQPLQQVEVQVLWSHVPERVHVFGPIEHATVNSRPRCGERDHDGHRFDILEGTYAVWIGGDDGAAGHDYHLLVTRDGTKLDPMATLAPIPTELSLADRALKHHYPYFRPGRLADWTAMFTTAPDRLFVYPRAEVKDGGRTVPAGEPLLVNWSNDSRTDAFRWDGTSVAIDTRLIGADRPARIALPTKAPVPAADSVSRAQDLAGPEDARAIAAYHKVDDRYTACVGNYLSRHDPTWGHHAEVYKIGPGGRVVNVSDQVGRVAERRCGGHRLDAARKTLLRTLARTRAARWKAHLGRVRTRFGL